MTRPYSEDITPWQPEHALRTYSLQEVRFSSGYLLGDYRKKFKPVLSSWLPTLDLAKVSLNNVEVRPGFQYPGELDFLYVFKKGREYGLIGIDETTFRLIATLFLDTDLFTDIAGDSMVEYLVRKLVYSFAKTWKDTRDSEISFYGLTDVGEIDIEGHLEVRFDLDSRDFSVHFGLGPELLQQLDYYLKGGAGGSKSSRGRKNLVRIGISLDPKSAADLELGQAVKPGQNLKDPFYAILPDNRRIHCRLGQFNQRFAFESMGTIAEDQEPRNFFVEFAQADVDESDSIYGPGSIYLSKTIVSKNAILTRDNALVADLVVYTSGDHFVLKKS